MSNTSNPFGNNATIGGLTNNANSAMNGIISCHGCGSSACSCSSIAIQGSPYFGGVSVGGGSTYTAQQIQGMLQGISYGLTQQEQEEMKQLKVDYEAEVKRLKLVIFKKLPADMRQHAITAITWQETISEMEAVKTDKSQRLQELEAKNATGVFGGITLQNQLYNFSIPYGLPLPTGLTAQDLKDAHLEATLEEQMLEHECEEKRTTE